jgi:arsenite oxidase large subunit
MAYPTPTARPKQTFMLFGFPTGVQGNVVSPGVNELILPNYKQTWGAIRKIADAPEGVKHLSFKSGCGPSEPEPESPRCFPFLTSAPDPVFSRPMTP